MIEATPDTMSLPHNVPERLIWENIEIFVLILAVTVALVFNSLGLAQTMSGNRSGSSRSNFLNANPTRNSFAVFKINLCISDFMILLVYALGKIIWLVTFEWCFGNVGCKLYKFLSSFSFYANSNIIVAIALDRLKCVYSTQMQGASSVGRAKIMIAFCWILAFICSLPQLYFWKTIQPTNSNWSQCVSVFVANTLESNSTVVRETSMKYAAIYEIVHQSTVFWIPLVIILGSYLCIVFKLVSCNFQRKQSMLRKRSEDERSYTLIEEIYTKKISDTWMSFLTMNSTSRSNNNNNNNNNSQQQSQKQSITRGLGPNGQTTTHRASGSLTWRKQLGSKVFRSACLIVVTHIVLWLPYNFISATRFFNEEFYHKAMENGGNVLEDFIIINSLLNPLIYAERKQGRQSRQSRRETR